ncbi:MAG: hypothetical protein MJE77_27565 [Proteobacteria bacterium]|nr:hypothetical protein [Pseudomonadota bacterium]
MFGLNRHHLVGAALGIAGVTLARPLLRHAIKNSVRVTQMLSEIKETVKENLDDIKAEAMSDLNPSSEAEADGGSGTDADSKSATGSKGRAAKAKGRGDAT